MKVVLLGKKGMLGSHFLKVLSGSKDFELFTFGRKELDITDYSSLQSTFSRISPDFVLNCTGYTAVDDCEADRDTCFEVNAKAPGEIAKACKAENAILVHFSTDYVFNGENSEGYKENDSTDPINVYGESKLAGEIAIAENMTDYYIVRTSWLFGDNGANFVKTMLGIDKSEISVVNDQTGSPTYTKDLCEAVLDCLLSPFLTDIPEHHKRSMESSSMCSEEIPFGIYHITNSGSTSWYEFSKEIFKLSGSKTKVSPVSSSEYKRPAKRPKYSILASTKFDFHRRPWQEALKVYLSLAQ